MTPRHCRSLLVARSGTVLIAAFLATGFIGLIPGQALACSCAGPQPMRAYAGNPLPLIFSGTIAPGGGPGVTVLVERWFQGGVDPVVRLDPRGFGVQSSACQIARPAAGSRWIFVASVPAIGELPLVGLCTPRGRLETPEGQAMLADATATFGGSPPAASAAPTGSVPPVSPVSPVGSTAPASAAPSPVTGAPGALASVAPALAGIAVAGLVLFGSLILLARRRSTGA